MKDVTLQSDTDSAECTLPTGSTAFIPIWAVHRSPLNWPDRPNEFVPERFLAKKTDQKDGGSGSGSGFTGDVGSGIAGLPHQSYAFVPFGGGRRACPGRLLAVLELKVAVARLVAMLKFTPHQSNHVNVDGTVGCIPWHPSIQAYGMVQQCLDNKIRISRRT